MSSRSIFTTSLLSLIIAGTTAIGCAAPAADEANEDAVAESSDELSAAAQQLVGKYYSHAPGLGGYARLTLNANGTYTAQVDISAVALCITYPCLGPEDGKWNASKSGGKLRLRLKANGEPLGRWYDAKKTSTELTITRGGKSQTLYVLGKDACLDDKDCSATEECGPKMCLMWCDVNDPFCCGPSTCQPKPPPPPPPPTTCCDPYAKPANGIEGVWCCGDGSWQYDIGSGDQSMSCSSHGGAGNVCAAKQCGGFAGLPCGKGEECIDDPTDDCDPESGGADCGGICVPESTPCGKSTCAAGEVCCNPLDGICTKPGEVCAF